MAPERFDQLKFDLWMALNATKTADWFNAHLFRLFCKADLGNRRKLTRAFPEEGEVFDAWWLAPNENEFYGEDLIARGRKAREDLQQ